MHRTISLVVLCLAPACGDGRIDITAPTIPSITDLNLAPQVSFDPEPVPARSSSDPAFDWEITFDATLRDVAHRGIRIDRAVVTVSDSSGVEVFSESLEAIVPGFSSRVPAGGSATWSFREVGYNLSMGRSAAGSLHLEMETGVGDFRTMNFGFAIN